MVPSGATRLTARHAALASTVLAQLDLVVRRSLRDVLHSVLVSTGTRSPSSVTSTIRSVPGVRVT